MNSFSISLFFAAAAITAAEAKEQAMGPKSDPVTMTGIIGHQGYIFDEKRKKILNAKKKGKDRKRSYFSLGYKVTYTDTPIVKGSTVTYQCEGTLLMPGKEICHSFPDNKRCLAEKKKAKPAKPVMKSTPAAFLILTGMENVGPYMACLYAPSAQDGGGTPQKFMKGSGASIKPTIHRIPERGCEQEGNGSKTKFVCDAAKGSAGFSLKGTTLSKSTAYAYQRQGTVIYSCSVKKGHHKAVSYSRMKGNTIFCKYTGKGNTPDKWGAVPWTTAWSGKWPIKNQGKCEADGKGNFKCPLLTCTHKIGGFGKKMGLNDFQKGCEF